MEPTPTFKTKIIAVVLTIFCFNGLIAQTYNMTNGSNITDCGNKFRDNGGNSDYSNNLNISETFNAGITGDEISFNFTAWSMADNHDKLYIYDGTSTTAPQVAGSPFSGTSPGTITSTSGSLTFSFTSNGSGNSSGWQADISCVAPPSTTVTTCAGTFYDSGGSGGNYNNNETKTTVICPTSSLQAVSVSFSSFSTQYLYDYLYVYDGNTTAAALLATYNYTTTPSTVVATTSNTSGCLTYYFNSNGSTTSSGWAATTSCAAKYVPPITPGVFPDCKNAPTVCESITLNGNNSGKGAVTDLTAGNRGCLSSGENNTAWYYFYVSSGGQLELNISPNNGTDDYDFAIYGPYNVATSSVTCPPTSAPVRCSWAAAGSTATINTGLNAGASGTSQGAGGDGFLTPLRVNAGEGYVMVVDNYTGSNSTFRLSFLLSQGAALNCFAIPLPIELISFKATEMGEYDLVEWSTATELFNDYFEVEISSDGKEFTSAGTVKGSGNSTTVKNYSFSNSQLFYPITYYRLKQVDYNGKTTEFSIVAVARKMGTFDFKLYPNPTSQDNLTIDLFSKDNSSYNIQIINAQGNIIKEINYSTVVGYNNIQLINIFDGISSGYYTVKIISEAGEQKNKSVVLLRN